MEKQPTMPFGKYQGALVANVPRHYLRWLRDNIPLREPLRAHVARALGDPDADVIDKPVTPWDGPDWKALAAGDG
jgi:hypothetical protein